MQQISKKNIWVIVSITILWLILHSLTLYPFGRNGQLTAEVLSAADLRTATWISIIYSLCCIPTVFVLNISMKKLLAKPATSRIRILLLLSVSCLAPSAIFALSGNILLNFGMPYWQYLCFTAAGMIVALLWGFWETRVFKAV
jgi:hypothetical protein